MRLYLSMMAMGTLGTIIYIIITHMFQHNLSLRWRQRYLRVNTLFYIIPFPLLICFVRNLIRNILDIIGYRYYDASIEKYNVRSDNFWHSMKVVNQNGGIVCYTGYEKLGPYVIAGSISCIVVILIILILYQKMTTSLKQDIVQTNFVLAGKKKVRIAESAKIQSPLSVGIFKPMILIPTDQNAYLQSWNAILQHELTHIQEHDSFYRLLTVVAVAVAWYNPLTYYLVHEHINVGEMICDEEAVQGLSKEQKKNYMYCMIVSTDLRRGPDMIVQHLGTKKSLTKRRIDNIMKESRKTWKRTVSCLVAVVCFGISSIPAMAYREPIENINNSNIEWTEADWNGEFEITVVPEEDSTPFYDIEEVDDFTLSDVVVVENSGECVAYQEEIVAERAEGCAHKYQEVNLYHHLKNSDGGCTVEKWSGQKCSKCGTISWKELVSTTTFKTCTHK